MTGNTVVDVFYTGWLGLMIIMIIATFFSYGAQINAYRLACVPLVYAAVPKYDLKSAIALMMGIAMLLIVRWVGGMRSARESAAARRATAAAERVKARQAETEMNQYRNQLANAHPARKPRYKFAQVDGMADIKRQLSNASDKWAESGHNGIILFGPPGNGKTYIAEAFAGEMNANFLECRVGDVASRWVNQSTETINNMFLAARAQAPCVIFLDEIDSILRNRGELMSMGDAEAPRLVNALLTNIEDMRKHKEYQVIVVAATNFLDKLDDAGIREGRFDFKVLIPPPDFVARVGILNRFCRIAIPQEILERAAHRWEGFAVVRLQRVAEMIGDLAQQRNAQVVTFQLMMEALREVQGQRGHNQKEGAKGLDDPELHFDEEMSIRLKGLARRMVDIEKIEQMGGTIPRGVLFGGKPGTGKTRVAQALARDSGWMFIQTTGQELAVNPEAIDIIIAKAEDLRPAIIFIDEADTLLKDRSMNPYAASTNKLLEALDGKRPLHDVMFIAATNFPESIDSAATRGGRFSEQYEFETPSEDTLLRIVASYMKSKNTTNWGFNADDAAEVLSGFTPADARDRLQQAINRSIGRGSVTVALIDLQSVV